MWTINYDKHAKDNLVDHAISIPLFRGTEAFPTDMSKPPMTPDQMKPIGDGNIGSNYGGPPSDPLPYGSGENGDPIASGW